jgi:hypothetical protein
MGVQPMDLATLFARLRGGAYASASAVANDLALVGSAASLTADRASALARDGAALMRTFRVGGV